MTAPKYDPARAKPETVLRLLLAGHCTDEQQRARDQLRSECRIPLRTRAEVDREAAQLVFDCELNDDSDLYIDSSVKARLWHLKNEVVSEPTSDQSYGSSGVDSAGFPPGSRAATGATLSDPEPCSCEEAESLRVRIYRAVKIIRDGALPGHTSLDELATAHRLLGILDGEA